MAVKETKITLKRPPFGETPLYYTNKTSDGSVAYGRSVRELLGKGVPRKLSREGLFSYLSYGCVYHPYTMVDGVYAVPPGCQLVIDGKNVSIERYWAPSFDIKRWTLDGALEATRIELMRAVGETVAGKNPAAFLSGGLDSSAIVALWRKQFDGEIRTYCVTHEDPNTDERKWARMVAEQNNTKHMELMLEDRMIRDWLDEAVASYDQPSLDGLNFWFATRLLREAGENAVLSGEGGDELFAGYWQFAKHRMAYKYAPYVRHLPRFVGCLMDTIATNEKVRKLAMLTGFGGDPYYVPRRVLSDWQIAKLLSPELLPRSPHVEDIGLSDCGELPDDLINRISWLEMQTVVSDMWMRDGYQTSVSNGIDVYTPLCDTKLADLLYTIPGKFKCDPNLSKPLLVRSVGDGIPQIVATRPKQGFSLPFDRYFSGDVKDRIDAFLSGGECNVFRPDAVRVIGRQYHDGKVYWSRIWALFMVENWCRLNNIEI